MNLMFHLYLPTTTDNEYYTYKLQSNQQQNAYLF